MPNLAYFTRDEILTLLTKNIVYSDGKSAMHFYQYFSFNDTFLKAIIIQTIGSNLCTYLVFTLKSVLRCVIIFKCLKKCLLYVAYIRFELQINT